jgi:hypothetical protein
MGRVMTRFVVDAGAVLYLASAGVEVGGAHKLLAPTLLRSQTLSALHEAVERGEIRPTSRATASRASGECRSGSSATPCSGVGLTQLQADAFVTLDAELARSVEGIVTTASIDALR